jgi:hypothetical protein
MEECGAEVATASSCVEAARICGTGLSFQAIVSAPRLPDGTWHELAEMARGLDAVVPVIVYVPMADGGWSDLLESGAFALLVPPYHREEVLRVLEALLRVVLPQTFPVQS